MKIGRFIKSSLSEWKGRNSCVIEVRGSDVRSPYLTSPELFEYDGPSIDEDEVIEYISSHRDTIESVVISGAEPLLQKDLYGFLKKLKGLKKPILLKTGGRYFDILDDLAGACMFDKVCIRVAAVPDPVSDPDVRRSLQGICNLDAEPEVEIVAVPGITDADIVSEIAGLLDPKCPVTLCQYDVAKSDDPDIRKTKPFKQKEALNLHASIKRYVKKVELKGF